ncbi:DUF1097 domain-containing protein [uncultured Amphritea sp.]|uniref:DUF1097 domain-containing protein n=1 Tax=Amphritea sp. TaxID=1872502 RepID=UPI0025FCF11B|nr:DUF1097 domain-containing protein [uncultured Amphritea sp.]
MNNLTALSISISLLGGLATYLAIGPLNGIFLIWAVFVAWGAFFAVGGTADAMKNTIVCGIFGVFLAWSAALIIINLPMAESLGLPLWAGIVVAATVLILCLAANIPALATIPASVFGYAPTFAYLLQTSGTLSNDVLLSANLSNPLLLISVSIIVGTLFGFASGQLGAKLTAAEA